MVTPNQAYRRDIDGLRALAVLLVVAFHAFPGAVPGGFVGVDVFFVISGFLISGLLFDWLREGRFSFLRFFARRVCRLFPALLTVVGVCLLFGWAALLPDEFMRLGFHARAGLIYMLNYIFSYEIGYFDVRAEAKPFLHLWSLAVEGQFYLIWPFVLFGAYKLKIRIEGLIAAILIASFVNCLTNPETEAREAFYFTELRLWELLAGAFLAQVQKTRGFGETVDALLGRVDFSTFLSCLGLAAIIGSAFWLDAQDTYPGFRAVFPVLGTVLVIASGPRSLPGATLLSCRAAVYVGLISYPLYLWHWPLLSFARIVFGEAALTPLVRLGLVGGSFLLAAGTFHFIEKPLRFGPLSRQRMALLLVLIAGLLGAISYGIEERKLRSYAGIFGPPKLETLAVEWPYPPKGAEIFDFGGQSLYRFDGDNGGVLFLGDCNMEQYLPRFLKSREAAQGRTKTALFMTAQDCLPIPGIVSPNRRADCKTYIDNAGSVLDLKTADKTIDTVVIAAHWIYYFYFGENYEIGGEPLATKTGQEKALNSLGDMIRHMKKKGVRVVVVLNIPAGGELAPARRVERSVLSFEMKAGPGGVPLDEVRGLYGPVLAKLEQTAREAGAEIIDPLAFLCAEGVCPALAEDGAPIYMDENHLHPDFVRDRLTYLDKIWGQ